MPGQAEEGALSFRVVRSAEARWQGTLPEGSGKITLGSGAFDGPYSLRARVAEAERAANPEELLGEAGHPPRDLHTTARVTLAQVGPRFNITRIELRTVGDVPGLDQASFHDLAEQAKDCTVSRALTGTEITLEASIAGS